MESSQQQHQANGPDRPRDFSSVPYISAIVAEMEDTLRLWVRYGTGTVAFYLISYKGSIDYSTRYYMTCFRYALIRRYS